MTDNEYERLNDLISQILEGAGKLANAMEDAPPLPPSVTSDRGWCGTVDEVSPAPIDDKWELRHIARGTLFDVGRIRDLALAAGSLVWHAKQAERPDPAGRPTTYDPESGSLACATNTIRRSRDRSSRNRVSSRR